jgi:hypothetical protein
MTGVPEVLILLPGLDIIKDKTAETQGVWNWSFAATHRAIPATECCG